MSVFQFMAQTISHLRYLGNRLCGSFLAENHDMKTFAIRLKARRNELGMSQVELARVSGVSQTTISDIERGRNDGSGKILDLARALKCRPEWLERGNGQMLPYTREDLIRELSHIKTIQPPKQTFSHENTEEFSDSLNFVRSMYSKNGEPPDPKHYGTIPVISWVQAGLFCSSPDLFQPGDAEDFVPAIRKFGPHTYALRVKRDSMISSNPGEKSYPEGCIIYVDPDKELTNGCKVVARIHENEEATFKKYSEDAGKRYLRPLNKDYEPIVMNETMHICGVVVGSWMDE